MSTKEKLINRFKKQPRDFTWDELVKLFGIFGFTVDSKGKTSGSRVVFDNGAKEYPIHKPHPSNIIKGYLMRRVLQFLKENNFIK